MCHRKLPSQSLHLTYCNDEAHCDIYSKPGLSHTSLNLLCLWKSQDHHIKVPYSNHTLISAGTYPFIHPQLRDVLSMTEANSALGFYTLLPPGLPCSISHPVSLSASLLSTKMYSNPWYFINTFLFPHNVYFFTFDPNYYFSQSSISKSLKEQSTALRSQLLLNW